MFSSKIPKNLILPLSISTIKDVIGFIYLGFCLFESKFWISLKSEGLEKCLST